MMELFEHQVKALDDTEGKNRVAYYLDMGLGKTFVGAEKMVRLGKKVNLIVCQKTKVDDWVEHIRTNYEGQFDVWDLTKKSEFQGFFTTVEQLKFITTIGVINYELAWRRKQLLQLQDFTLMLDESSLIQNPKAKQTKCILNMKPDNVILLSGTPVAGKYENLWTQMHLLGWSITEKLYKNTYINWKKIDSGGFTHWIVDKVDPYKNVDRLKRKLIENGAVFMKTEECFDLPEQTFIPVKVDTPKTYKKFMNDCIITIDSKNLCEFKDDSDFYGEDTTPRIELVGDTTLTKRLYARQICSQYNQNKLDAFRNLVESTEDRLIVFYNFNEELHAMQKILKGMERPMSVINGQEKDLTAYEHESDSVTLVQYQAGAMGLNLQKANKVIYFSLTERSELFEQSKKRIHRIGQKKPCFYYVMTCRNSIEECIQRTLKERKDYTDELFKSDFGH